MAKKFYAVRQGRINGVYETWAECQKQVTGYKGAVFKSFPSYEDACAFVKGEEFHEPEKNAGSKSAAEFFTQNENAAVAYVDGSFNIKTHKFSYGAVILHGGETLCFNKVFSDTEMAKMRNVAGEIMGACAAMQWAADNGIKELCIYYDYAGIEFWCTGVWKTNLSYTARYVEFYRGISEKVKIRFYKVKGHSGDKYNDMADKLAKEAAGIN